MDDPPILFICVRLCSEIARGEEAAFSHTACALGTHATFLAVRSALMQLFLT
jgi:hypothetical protein